MTILSSSVVLTWYPPGPEEWNGEVISYVVLYQLLETLGGSMSTTASSTMSLSIPSSGQSLVNTNDPTRVRLPLQREMALIKRLNEHSLYKMCVYFEIKAGRSGNSEWIQLETLSDGEIGMLFTSIIVFLFLQLGFCSIPVHVLLLSFAYCKRK